MTQADFLQDAAQPNFYCSPDTKEEYFQKCRVSEICFLTDDVKDGKK